MLKTIAIASDHKGFNLKQSVIKYLQKENYKIIDYGPSTDSISVDYPDYAQQICQNMLENVNLLGILVCNTGVGMAIAANRFKHIRAAVCNDIETVEMSRKHNDINILVLGASKISGQKAIEMIKVFLNTKFESGRHLKRIDKL